MPIPEGSFSLGDKASLAVISNKETQLKCLILQNSDSLRELSFSGSYLEGSIGSIISCKMGASASLTGWEEEGEPEITETSEAPALSPDSDVSESSLIELAPGVERILRSSEETWQAIRDGRTTITKCAGCSSRLHGIEDAEFVMCPDCKIANPVSQSIGGVLLECDWCDSPVQGDIVHTNGVSLGVKARDIVRWLQGSIDVNPQQA